MCDFDRGTKGLGPGPQLVFSSLALLLANEIRLGQDMRLIKDMNYNGKDFRSETL